VNHQSKFIATKPRDGISLPDYRLEPICNEAKSGIPSYMAQRVVYGFKAVQIYEQNG
jgi:hypothetical protein